MYRCPSCWSVLEENEAARSLLCSPELCSLCLQAGTRRHSGSLLPALSPAGAGSQPQALGWGLCGPKQVQGRPWVVLSFWKKTELAQPLLLSAPVAVCLPVAAHVQTQLGACRARQWTATTREEPSEHQGRHLGKCRG